MSHSIITSLKTRPPDGDTDLSRGETCRDQAQVFLGSRTTGAGPEVRVNAVVTLFVLGFVRFFSHTMPSGHTGFLATEATSVPFPYARVTSGTRYLPLLTLSALVFSSTTLAPPTV